MARRLGKYTLELDKPTSIIDCAAIGSKKESEGPLAEYFDQLSEDSTFKQQSWEKAESKMLGDTITLALSKTNLASTDIDAVLTGDLLNQCIGSTFGLREFGIPHIGLYSACATMTEAMGIGSLMLEVGGFSNVIAATASHFCSAERQYRFPLEYGGQRPPTSQWTVTGAGAAVLSHAAEGPFITRVHFGCIEDKGIKDANNMGGAMAPAATMTLKNFLHDTGEKPENYDLILTGDLGYIGSDLLYELMDREGYDIRRNHSDCGKLIYNREEQDVHGGGSGCGCCASVFCSYIMSMLRDKKIKRMLFIATGALLSPTSTLQGESIPAVAHLIEIITK